MKRTLTRIAYLTIILSLLLSMPFAIGAQASGDTFRTTGGVNVRAEANADSSVVTVVQEGTDVTVLNHDPAGWSRVQVGNSTGFIRSDFLRFMQSGTFRTTGGVNIRASGSRDSDVVRTVNEGESVEVLEHDPAGWSRVQVGNSTGFIRSDFLTRGGVEGAVAAERSSEEPTPAPSGGAVIATLWTTGNVNFRTEASDASRTSIIRTLARGTSVEVLENRTDGWSRVRHNETEGFVSSAFLASTAPASGSGEILRATGPLNFRVGASTNSSVIRTLARGTSVEVLENQADGWSRVRHDGTEGFVSTEFLTAGEVSGTTTLRTNGNVRFRAGPSTESAIIDLLAPRTSVEVIAQNANGWSSVRVGGRNGYIYSSLLSVEGGGGTSNVEFVDWSTARRLVPIRTDMRVVDVRTGISFNLRAFSLGGHADVEPPTRADTEAILRSRNGVWEWSPRPVWVTMGGRTFAAALNGMPHGGSTISGNGMDGHICLHFGGTVTRSQSYQRALRAAVQEAFDARPR